LNNLCVDMWRSQRFDLSHDEVANAFNCLFKSDEILSKNALPLTLRVSFSKIGSRSFAALLVSFSDFFLNMFDLRSSSASILAHDSSIWPSEILEMTSGGKLNSSTNGPNAFSTCFRLSNRLFSAADRVCRDSMSAETMARSLRKLARLSSTDSRTSSQASIDR
jgi:hypothetical protein